MNQKEFLHKYADKVTEKFNDKVFTRSDDQIIDSLENIILSCQRTGYITIKVKKFTVIDDYCEIRKRLRDYEEYLLSKPSSRNKGPQDNRYAYIDLKRSDLRLLIVTYYLESKGESEDLDVLIAIPRVVDKFYFRLNGSMYSAMYQIVDASTYNTSTSKSSTKHMVTLKTIFQPIRIFRNMMAIKTTDGEEVECCTYDNNTFKKSVPVSLYFFAKFGFYKALQFIGVYGSIMLSDTDPENPKELYTFRPKKSEVYISVPRMLFDKNQVLQHVVYSICSTVKKDTTYQEMFTDSYWVTALGIAFNNQTDPHEKGKSILCSLELIYDYETKSEIHLPEEYKHDAYCIIRWMIWEYNNLRIKDNLNILTKKLRCSEYIAAIYGAKLSRGIYKLSDRGKTAELSTIRKFIITHPMYLITQMGRRQLINFRGMVTDMDSLLAMKFTYKGDEAGIQTISSAYKLLHPSNLGVLDPDASSASDPGVSGSVAPFIKLYNGMYFSKFQEPITWEKEYADLYNSYKNTRGLVEVLDFKRKILGDKTITNNQMIEAEKSAEIARNLVKTIPRNEEESEYGGLPLEGSGRIQYE